MPSSHIESASSFLSSGTETLNALLSFFVFSSIMSERRRVVPMELFMYAFSRSWVYDDSQLAIYISIFLMV